MDKTTIVSAARKHIVNTLAAIQRFHAEHGDKPAKGRDWIVRQTQSAKQATLRLGRRAREAALRARDKRQ